MNKEEAIAELKFIAKCNEDEGKLWFNINQDPLKYAIHFLESAEEVKK